MNSQRAGEILPFNRANNLTDRIEHETDQQKPDFRPRQCGEECSEINMVEKEGDQPGADEKLQNKRREFRFWHFASIASLVSIESLRFAIDVNISLVTAVRQRGQAAWPAFRLPERGPGVRGLL